MSEDIKIHHRSLQGQHSTVVRNEATDDWTKVTCGDCKLEMPVAAVAGRTEYRTPADVAARDADPAIGGPSLADMLTEHEQRRLKAVRAWEQHARETMAYWLKEWETAVSLLRTLERD